MERALSNTYRRLGSKRCGRITYCRTLVRPAYCPFCLGDASDSASQRLESWCRDHALWLHVDKHFQGCEWPRRCPHPLCDASLSDVLDLRFHFIDEHGLSRTVAKDAHKLGITQWYDDDQDEDEGEEEGEELQVPTIKRNGSHGQLRSLLAVVQTTLAHSSSDEDQAVFIDDYAFAVVEHGCWHNIPYFSY